MDNLLMLVCVSYRVLLEAVVCLVLREELVPL